MGRLQEEFDALRAVVLTRSVQKSGLKLERNGKQSRRQRRRDGKEMHLERRNGEEEERRVIE